MQDNEKSPRPQPTESEAIVAAQRAGLTPLVPLAAPVPLPVDQAANESPPLEPPKPPLPKPIVGEEKNP